MVTTAASPESEIWHPTPPDKPADSNRRPKTITLYEAKGNGFHLAAIVRKYTAARVTFQRGRQVVVVEIAKLYDALGLLRSLQYDVKEFNDAVEHTAKTMNGDEPSDDNDEKHKPRPISANERRYATFRLSRQAAAFGVRLSSAVNDKGLVSVPGLDSLVSYIEEFHAGQIAAYRANIEANLVQFDALQEYMRPGMDVVDRGMATGQAGVATLMRVRACYYSRGKSLFGIVSTFYVALEFVVAAGDGEYVVVEASVPQSEYGGSRSIEHGRNDMFTRPTDRLLEELRERGIRYEVVTACTPPRTTNGHNNTTVGAANESSAGSGSGLGSGILAEYAKGGFLPITPPSGGGYSSSSRNRGSYSRASRSGGRIVVDTALAWTRGVHCAKANGLACDAVTQVLKLYAQQQTQRLGAAASSSSNSKQQGLQTGETYTTGAAVSSDADEMNELLVLRGPLPDRLLARTWPVVSGFSLQARSWGSALVHGLTNVNFHEEAFDALVLPASRKKVIRALVTNHEHASAAAKADVMAGKGEGSIFLLHGPPGVGKTLTAEAIAEMLHKPLYVVSMGELGTSPEVLEDRLQDVLDLCVPWKALVLIDEAEMLLERRSKNDIVRNAMVCVMLRLLEYYSGILFLTTNRVESLDPAFQSRVTCALRYDALTAESRLEIWRTTLERVGASLANLDLKQLAAYDINGRQIKNAIQLALALSRHDDAPLGQDHLLQTLEITTSFVHATTPSTDEAD